MIICQLAHSYQFVLVVYQLAHSYQFVLVIYPNLLVMQACTRTWSLMDGNAQLGILLSLLSSQRKKARASKCLVVMCPKGCFGVLQGKHILSEVYPI
jgi:hypothetical protein